MEENNELNNRLSHLKIECNGLYEVIGLFLLISRTIWETVYFEDKDDKYIVQRALTIDKEEILDKLANSATDPKLIRKALDIIYDGFGSFDKKSEKWYISSEVCLPFPFIHSVFSSYKSEEDIRYYIKKNIRDFYQCPLSSETIYIFQILTDYLNGINLEQPGRQIIPIYRNDLKQCYKIVAEQYITDDKKLITPVINQIVNCFFESCRFVKYLMPSFVPKSERDVNKLHLINTIDAEFLISNLFGFCVNIPGFNVLLGGGGLILPENFKKPETDPFNLYNKTLKGRITSIVGECGCGKSIMGLQMAAEVASKGGISWVMPLEQTIEECYYTLRTIKAYTKDSSFSVGTNYISINQSLNTQNNNKGSLIILKPEEEALTVFLETVLEDCKDLNKDALKLIVIDPINTIGSESDNEKVSKTDHFVTLRKKTVHILNKLKAQSVNLLLIAEDFNDSERAPYKSALENNLSFIENISDTLIHLSLKKKHNYAQRYFEIRKSRMQREQRGEHSFSIVAGKGIHIYPSSSSVGTRVSERRNTAPEKRIQFGLKCLDEYVLMNTLYDGDITVLFGPAGTYKTYIGYYFLRNSSKPVKRNKKAKSEPVSILFDAINNRESILAALEYNSINGSSFYSSNGNELLHIKDGSIKIVLLPSGHVYPGRILQAIEREIEKVRLEGNTVQRIVINGISQWQLTSPKITEDRLFSTTLMKLLRGYNTSCLLICGNYHDPILQDSLKENSDCTIQFDHFNFRGQRRVMLQVTKTRDMTHKSENFELKWTPDDVAILPSSLLLRTNGNQAGATPVKIRLYFHIDSSIQLNYYDSILNAIKSVLSENTELDFQDRLYLGKAMETGRFSAMDELQILQIDEQQLTMHNPDADKKTVQLMAFNQNLIESEFWDDLLDNTNDSLIRKQSSFSALPFIQNISLLAFREDSFAGKKLARLKDWELIAKDCYKWEKENIKTETDLLDESLIYFDFPRVTAENFNSFFFELLLFFLKKYPVSFLECPIREIVKSKAALKAGRIFRQLCKRSVMLSNKEEQFIKPPTKDELKEPVRVNTNALVWRHWYTSLNQMFLDLKKAKLDKLVQVGFLPGNISISSEWYLGIPSFSSAPDAGLELMKLMTTRDAELNRVRMGVGLPTRKSFYNDVGDQHNFTFSPYYEIPAGSVLKVLSNSFKRSNFQCYQNISNILAFHLTKVIDIDEPPFDMEKEKELYNDGIENKVSVIFQDFERKLDFVQKYDFFPSSSNDFNLGKCKKCRHVFSKLS